MTKRFAAALIALAVPAAASASSINLSSALVRVNKDMGVSSASAFGNANNASPAADPPGCFGGNCPVGVGDGCTSSPENPTALLAVLGASGLLLGRIGYGRVSRRSAVPVSVD